MALAMEARRAETAGLGSRQRGPLGNAKALPLIALLLSNL